MFQNVLVALKEGDDHDRLLQLVQTAAPAPATLQLATLIRVGTNEDEPARLRKTQKRLDELADELRGTGYDVTTYANFIAVAAGAGLVKMAHDRACDLIVIGLAKRTRVGKALLGSDAQRVLLSAHCPVIVRRID